MAILGGVTTCLCHSFVAPAEDGDGQKKKQTRYLGMFEYNEDTGY